MHANFSDPDQTCVFLITDTKTVWAEGAYVCVRFSSGYSFGLSCPAVLSRQQLGHRWLMLNANSTSSYLSHSEQDSRLNQVLQYLVDAHSPDLMEGLSFDIIGSRYSV